MLLNGDTDAAVATVGAVAAVVVTAAIDVVESLSTASVGNPAADVAVDVVIVDFCIFNSGVETF